MNCFPQGSQNVYDIAPLGDAHHWSWKPVHGQHNISDFLRISSFTLDYQRAREKRRKYPGAPFVEFDYVGNMRISPTDPDAVQGRQDFDSDLMPDRAFDCPSDSHAPPLDSGHPYRTDGSDDEDVFCIILHSS